MTELTHLYLSNNHVSDISALSGLTKLTDLSLGGNKIITISSLNGLTELTDLELWSNQINSDDIEKLKQLLPDCNIQN